MIRSVGKMQILDAREVGTCSSDCDLKAQSVPSLWDRRNSVAFTCTDVFLHKFGVLEYRLFSKL
jgi:hypothetical protein